MIRFVRTVIAYVRRVCRPTAVNTRVVVHGIAHVAVQQDFHVAGEDPLVLLQLCGCGVLRRNELSLSNSADGQQRAQQIDLKQS